LGKSFDFGWLHAYFVWDSGLDSDYWGVGL